MELGKALETSGRYSEAKDQFQAALRSASSKDGRNFAARVELGTVSASMGQYVEAEQWDNEAVRLGLELYGKQAPELALPFTNLAALYRDQGESGRAEEFGRRALGLIANTDTVPPSTRAYVLGTLGGILHQGGKLPEAETLLRESIRIAESLPAPADILAGGLNNLAGIYAKTDRPEAALATYQTAYALCEKSGANDPCHFFILAGMAAVHANSGHYQEAVAALQAGIRVAEAGGAANTMQLRDALAAEAVWLHKLKREDEARQVRARAKQVAQTAAQNSYSQNTVDVRQIAESARPQAADSRPPASARSAVAIPLPPRE